MRKSVVWIVAFKELRDLLRDRRTILSMIIIPVLTMPLLLGAIGYFTASSVEKMREQQIKVAVIGGDFAPDRLAPLAAMPNVTLTQDIPTGRLPDSLIYADDMTLVLELQPEMAGIMDRLQEEEEVGPAEINLYYDSTSDAASIASKSVIAVLQQDRSQVAEIWLSNQGIQPTVLQPWVIQRRDVAPQHRRGADLLSRLLPYMILLLTLQAAMYPAMDLTAGEKERSTIETLLVNPVKRLDLVLGKFIATVAMSIGSALFTLGSQYIFFNYAGSAFMSGFGDIGLDIQLNLGGLAIGLLMMVPMVLTFCAVLLAISIFARSMKEAQSYLGPIMMLVIFPSMASMIPGIELSYGLAMIPVFNVALVMKQALLLDFSQPGLLLTVFLANTAYAVLALTLAAWIFRREQVIFRS